ncbi:MAG: hypothetical protein KAR40_16280 [Candidatus Sabulitectum sp.]|nr:hypothetical protein [Candidatus Sabulitectum sp.]
MNRIELHKIKNKSIAELLVNELDNNLFIIEDVTDKDLLNIINDSYNNIPIYIDFENSEVVKNFEYLKNFTDVKLTLPYGCGIKNLSFLSDFQNLKKLSVLRFTRERISFKDIEHINGLEILKFDGIENKGQYKFVNQQKNLKKLDIRAIDLSLVEKNDSLEVLRVGSTLKSEKILAEKFPNLRILNLHGCSRLTDHSFIGKLNFIEDITINYNSHITSFPKLKNIELVKRIVMLTCPNFSDIDSIMPFINLETFCLTSYDKLLQAPIYDFQKLRNLKKLMRVYTEWGRRNQADLDVINEVYKETNWINSMV